MRQTSIESYNAIKNEGLLGRLQFDIYSWLYAYGPASQNKVVEAFKLRASQSSITPRFAELEKSGVIQTVGESTCPMTGRNVLMWDVTSKLPIKIQKKETRLEKACREAYEKGFHDGVMSSQKQGRLF